MIVTIGVAKLCTTHKHMEHVDTDQCESGACRRYAQGISRMTFVDSPEQKCAPLYVPGRTWGMAAELASDQSRVMRSSHLLNGNAPCVLEMFAICCSRQLYINFREWLPWIRAITGKRLAVKRDDNRRRSIVWTRSLQHSQRTLPFAHLDSPSYQESRVETGLSRSTAMGNYRSRSGW
jgi:hypothetical protein